MSDDLTARITEALDNVTVALLQPGHPLVSLLAEARDEITRLTERLSDSWYVDIGERLDAALTEVARLRELLDLCPSCGDNGDCGETGFECGHEFHGNGEH